MVIEEIGIVKSVDGVLAIVDVPRKSACEGCTAGTCRPEEQFMEIEAVNHVGAKVGQRVRVSVKPLVYMKGSMLVYGLPALGLVAGAVLGKEVISRFFRSTDPDILSAISGFAMLIATFICIKIWVGRKSDSLGSKPVIDEILTRQ